MNNDKRLQLDALDFIEERIKFGFSGEWADLTSAIFYLNFYVSSYSEAKEVLSKIGVFDVLKKVKEDEEMHHDKVITDLSDAVDVLNAYFIMIGEGMVGRLAAETNLRTIKEEYKEEILEEIESLREDINDY